MAGKCFKIAKLSYRLIAKTKQIKQNSIKCRLFQKPQVSGTLMISEIS